MTATLRSARTRLARSSTAFAAALLVAAMSASASAATSPLASPSPSPSPSSVSKVPPGPDPARNARGIVEAGTAVESIRSEVAHRVSRARFVYDAKPMSSNLKPEIGRALDRGVDQVQTQLVRIEKSQGAIGSGTAAELEVLHDEIDALVGIADVAADRIANVRTKGGDTEETLQDIAEEIRKISERAESVAEDMENVVEEAESVADGTGTAVRVRVGDREFDASSEEIAYGGDGITVAAGESVAEAVTFGGPIVVIGEVEGDAVAVVGSITVQSTGRVRGDAVAIGGRVIVEEGGRVDGDITNIGPGAIGAALASGGSAPRRHHPMSTPARIGARMIKTAITFVVFFLLGLLAITLAPERTEIVAATVARHPFKSGGLGLLLIAFVLPLLGVLLFITVIGILPLTFVVIPGTFLAGFLGYVALATAIGQRLPTNVDPTRTAVFALGAVVMVVLGAIPIFGVFFWIFTGFVGVGAVVMTRFGQQPEGAMPSPPAPTDGLASPV